MRSFFLLGALWGVIDFAFATTGNHEAAPPAKRDGGFSSDCFDIGLNGWTLTADCKIDSGNNYIPTSLDLKQCLGWGTGGYILCQPGE